MPSSSGTRHRAEAIAALLVAARASIDAASAALNRASSLALDEDGPAEAPVPAPPVVRRPRAPRRAGAAAALSSPVVSPTPAASAVEPQQALAQSLAPLQQYQPLPEAVAKILTGPDVQTSGRVLVEAMSGSRYVKDHGPAHAELKRLVSLGVLAYDGLRYRLGAK